jgi:putative peptidoglycan lipid II flippase
MGVLNAHQRFLLPALAPGMYNLGIIFGLIFLTPIMGVYGAAWGTVIGALAHFLVQLPGVISIRMPYRPLLDLRHPGVAEVARLMGPRVIGLAIVQINFWVNINLASGMVEGSVSALQLAFMLLLLPQGVIAQSVATAVFPTFSAQAAHKDYDALRRTFGRVLRAVLFLSIPATVGLVLLRLPIVRILFERNMFTLTDSRATAWALLFFGLGLVAHSLVEIVTRAFYAMHDTRTPVLIGGAAMVLNVILSLTLIRFIGVQGDLARGPFAGLALANTLATTLEGVLLLVYLKPRVGGLEGRKLLLSVGKAGLASIVMGGVIVLLGPLGQNLGLLIGTIIIIALGGVAFWGVAWLLGSDEARLLTRVILTRLQQ